MVIRVILSTEEVLTFFVDYKYNALFKVKNPIFRILGEDVLLKEKNEKLFVLDFHPIAILFNNSFLILNSKVEKIFNFNHFYDKQIYNSKEVIASVLSINLDNLKSFEQKKYLVRGIKEDSIQKFSSFTIEEKNEHINTLKKAYKSKYNKDFNVLLDTDGKINIDSLSSKEKLEIYKLLADKSSVKILGETLATALD